MSKIKIKTKRGAVKRFKKIANGYKRKRAFTSHILTKMKQKRKRNLRGTKVVRDCDELSVARMLGDK